MPIELYVVPGLRTRPQHRAARPYSVYGPSAGHGVSGLCARATALGTGTQHKVRSQHRARAQRVARGSGAALQNPSPGTGALRHVWAVALRTGALVPSTGGLEQLAVPAQGVTGLHPRGLGWHWELLRANLPVTFRRLPVTAGIKVAFK